jgi:hypothetical protein
LQTRCAIVFDAASHRIEQFLAFEGLRKKVYRPGFHRSNRRPHVILRGKKNQGCFPCRLCQSELKIETAHAR